MIPDPARYPMGANPSFFDLVTRLGESAPAPPSADGPVVTPHGTTVLALKFADGVVMAGDRRAVEAYAIADDQMNKVFQADEHSAIGIAGVAATAIELVRLFQTELEHYEKVEGDQLSLEGKANRLGRMVGASFPLVLQGLVVVPIFAGYDVKRKQGRIFRYDAIGGRYEESDYHANGSGGRAAKGSLKKRWRDGLARDEALDVALEALVDASEEDTATGGPDPVRGIYPSIFSITAEGVAEIPMDDVKTSFTRVIETRTTG